LFNGFYDTDDAVEKPKDVPFNFDNLGCVRNIDACGRKASNGPTGPNFKGPYDGSAPPGHPNACVFDGLPDCSRCPDDPECVNPTGADKKQRKNYTGGGGFLDEVFIFRGKAHV
jgi:hypothetical protein